jgi:ribosome-binding factor A
MNKEATIKLQRTESLLKELVPEALASLSDSRINNITVTDVKCSRGKYDAVVYLDKGFMTNEEQSDAIALLKRASSIVQRYILESEGWFRAPKLTFKFDDSVEKQNSLDKLFKQIQSELSHDKS